MATRSVVEDVPKAPVAVLTYGFDWAARGYLAQLGSGVTVSSAVWTLYAENGESPVVLTKDSQALAGTNTKTLITLSSGTADADYLVNAFVTFSDGSKDERTFRVQCRPK
jgi:hypothetical protein